MLRYLLILFALPLCAAPILTTTAEASGYIATTHDPAGISRACGSQAGSCVVGATIPADEVDGSFYAYGSATAADFSLLADAYVDVLAHTYSSEPPPEVNFVVFNEAYARSSAQMEDQLVFAGTGQGTIRYTIEAWWTPTGTAEFWHEGAAAPLINGQTVEFMQSFTFGVPFTIRASVQSEAFAEIIGTSDKWAGLNFQIVEVSQPQMTENPEPATWLLMAGGLAVLLFRRARTGTTKVF